MQVVSAVFNSILEPTLTLIEGEAPGAKFSTPRVSSAQKEVELGSTKKLFIVVLSSIYLLSLFPLSVMSSAFEAIGSKDRCFISIQF